jgi:hypothetical protein
MDDDAIRAIVTRLARPYPAGGDVVERAAILAEGADFSVVVMWIIAHGGKPETRTSAVRRRGLYGSRLTESGGSDPSTPLRFVLPAGALA